MELLKAVNAVLPHLGEHPITRIEGARHPTVDLILAAIERHRLSLLSSGWWFNEITMTIPVNSDNMIDVPKDSLAVYGIDCQVEIDGEKFFDLANGTRYFTKPITVRIVRDIEFTKLPVAVALYITYSAGAEVYLQDYGRENTVPELQDMATKHLYLVEQENLRKRNYNSRNSVRRSIRAVKFR